MTREEEDSGGKITHPFAIRVLVLLVRFVQVLRVKPDDREREYEL